jgi:uncharacterized protein YutE (UPF0331/DUF86 family)
MDLNHDRLRGKLNDISQSLARLERLRLMGREAFLGDEDSRDIARSRLLTAMEASLNICYHLTAKRLQRVPEDYAQCFLLLGEAGLIPGELAQRLSRMARFRNRIVHLYWDIDYDQVYDILEKDIEDLHWFSREVASLL